jgi:hypothetical protein
MNYAAKALVLAAALSLAGRVGPAGAQNVWQADVQITALDVSELDGKLVARAVIASDGRGEARAVHVEILLPLGVGVSRVGPGCSASVSPPGVSDLRARVMCDLGTLPMRGTREVLVITTLPPAGTPKTFGVFALSDTPDPNPRNNFAEKTLP